MEMVFIYLKEVTNFPGRPNVPAAGKPQVPLTFPQEIPDPKREERTDKESRGNVA